QRTAGLRVVVPALARTARPLGLLLRLLRFDVCPSESSFGGEAVVGTTLDADVRRVVAASEGAWLQVVELEESACRTALAQLVDKRALLSVAFEDLTSHGCGHVARAHLPARRHAHLNRRAFRAG